MKKIYGHNLAESECAESFTSIYLKKITVRPPKRLPESEKLRFLFDNSKDELRKFRRAVNQSSSLIIITDNKGTIEYVNPKFTAITGYELDEIKGKTPAVLKSGETPQSEYKKLWDIILSGREWHGEFHNRKKNGEFFWDLSSISPVLSDSGEITHFICVKEDITQRKASEEELRLAKEEAEKSERLKTEFLAQISHEIRTPVNTMMSFISLIRDELHDKLSEDLRSGFRMIDNGARRLIRTIDLLLDMSQAQSGSLKIDPVEIDLGREVLENLIFDFHSVAKKKGLSLKYVNSEVKALIKGDLYTVNQIFVNLIDNAIKFTSKGTVEVKVYRNAAKKVCVDVKDTGVGISEEYLPKLFTPFSQEKTGYTRQFDGNGLGLALVEKYAALNNAEIQVQSRKDEGSVFTVVFG